MNVKRRDFLKWSAGSAVANAALFSGLAATAATHNRRIAVRQRYAVGVEPISLQERWSRIAKAQKLMTENRIQALIMDAGTSLLYFTGVHWWPSERPLVAIIPVHGEVKYICPAFEADRLRELIKIGTDVRTWEEDESPYKKIVGALTDAGIHGGQIGMEERLRFFIFDGVRKLAPHLNFVSGDPVTVPCRLIKSPAEIALLQAANDITVAAIKACISNLKEGMSPGDLSAIIDETQTTFGAQSDGALVNIGEASAMPHGSIKKQALKKGNIVLMDCGCKVEGYTSDITRTVVFGVPPTRKQQQIWDLEKKAQAAGFAAARIGQPCETVDLAARKVLTDAGFGPGYRLPGCPHRTGHGIGMDGHEWGFMVLGNKQPLQTGMCFSVEPTIVLPGEFGVRLEDCAYMTEEGPKWFSQPSPSIDKPFADA